ncbi:hypothetical protein ABEB36_008997 [Hypothenemus hampei]|uniref:Uncharacterized protein n=1 Tax=Hypothenemus hampei TaxID=57062 RepID=A0ABD1ENV1_HYPHA
MTVKISTICHHPGDRCRYISEPYLSLYFQATGSPYLYSQRFYLYLNCNFHWLQKFSGQNIENENRNESSAFYMISSHDETQPETPPTLAAISPSLPSSPPPSSTISVEGSVDGPVTGSVDGIVKERIKKRKRTTRAEQFLKDAISHYSDLRENWCKSRLQPNTK